MLHFYWNAVLKDNKNIPQFDSEGKENSFGLVQEQEFLQTLEVLEIMCAEDGKPHLAVSLTNGNFFIRGAVFHPYNALTNEDVKYRIIFYRRKRGHLGSNLQQIGKPYLYRILLGWQCTFNGLNYQRIIFYDPSTGGIEIKAKR